VERICVFAGSGTGSRPDYSTAAQELGTLLAARGLEVVYGGGHTGLMGVLADAALAGGGSVVGIIPEALQDRELAHTTVSRLEVVDSMHSRKARMAELADAFIALPGGIGTLEELFEIFTWAQLGLHAQEGIQPGLGLAVAAEHGHGVEEIGLLSVAHGCRPVKGAHGRQRRVHTGLYAVQTGPQQGPRLALVAAEADEHRLAPGHAGISPARTRAFSSSISWTSPLTRARVRACSQSPMAGPWATPRARS